MYTQAGFSKTGSGASALEKLGGRVSAHIPEAPGTGETDEGIQVAVASRAMGRAVAPTWPAIALVVDRITGAKERRNPDNRQQVTLEFFSVGY